MSCVCALLIAFPALGDPSKCNRSVARIALGKVREGAENSLFIVFGSITFPVFLSAHGLAQAARLTTASGRERWFRRWKQFFKEFRVPAVGYLGLAAFGQVGATTEEMMDDATEDFEIPREDDVIVAVATSEGTRDRAALAQRFRRKYGKNPKVIQLFPKDYADLISQLKSVAKTHGQITKIDFHAHGAPGYFEMSEQIGVDRPHAGLFAKDAKVRIYSCNTGNGQEGMAFSKKFGEIFLDQGGEIASSRVFMLGKLSEVGGKLGISAPDTMLTRRLDDLCMFEFSGARGVLPSLAYYKGYEEKFSLSADRVLRVKIPPRKN